MTIELGDTVWIPCEVTCGVFSDERNVRFESPSGQWAGVVDVTQLRDEIADGQTAIRATIVEAAHGECAARLPGQTTHHQFLSLTEAACERLRQA